MGYTEIKLPYWGKDEECDLKECLDYRLRYNIITIATSGTIKTKYFGDKFDAEKVEPNIKYDTMFYPPEDQEHDGENITLSFGMEYEKILGSDTFWDEYATEIKNNTRDITPPGEKVYFVFERKIFSDVLQEMEMNLMPGFKLQWNYSVELQPDEYTETSETFFTNKNVLKQYKTFFRYNIHEGIL